MDVLRSRIQKLGASSGERRLIYATRIDKSNYWVWRIPGTPGTAHLCRIAFVRQTAEGKGELGSWDLYQQFSERATPEAISRRLLKVEFYPTELESLEY